MEELSKLKPLLHWKSGPLFIEQTFALLLYMFQDYFRRECSTSGRQWSSPSISLGKILASHCFEIRGLSHSKETTTAPRETSAERPYRLTVYLKMVEMYFVSAGKQIGRVLDKYRYFYLEIIGDRWTYLNFCLSFSSEIGNVKTDLSNMYIKATKVKINVIVCFNHILTPNALQEFLWKGYYCIIVGWMSISRMRLPSSLSIYFVIQWSSNSWNSLFN